MKYLQTRILKILPVILFTFFSTPASSQSLSYRLAQADSLFGVKQYTQSFAIYDALLSVHQYSPAMLLKMAFIQEGLGKVSRSLFYLSLYYQTTGDEQALAKMQELAAKHKLEGYQNPQRDQFYFQWKKLRYSVAGVLLAFAIFFGAVVYRQKKSGRKPITAWIVQMIFLLLLATHLHFPLKEDSVIVADANTYLMSGPSAGASVIAVVGEGNKLRVRQKKDVWLEVEWFDKPAYVRENRVLTVAL
jgi:hypothetical protein